MVLQDLKTTLKKDSLAWWSYMAGLFSLFAYGAGIVYCGWAIAQHEDGNRMLDGSLTPSIWQAFWAFDLCMYVIGMFSTVVLVIGVMQANQYWFLYWLLISCILAGKHFVHLILILAFSRQILAVVIGSVQFGVALVQALFIFTVIAKYDQIRRIDNVIQEGMVNAKRNAAYRNAISTMMASPYGNLLGYPNVHQQHYKR